MSDSILRDKLLEITKLEYTGAAVHLAGEALALLDSAPAEIKGDGTMHVRCWRHAGSDEPWRLEVSPGHSGPPGEKIEGWEEDAGNVPPILLIHNRVAGEALIATLRYCFPDSAPAGETPAFCKCGFQESAHPVDIDGPGAGEQVFCAEFQPPPIQRDGLALEDHGCVTGDCPHSNQVECFREIVRFYAQRTEPTESEQFCKYGLCGGKADHDGYCEGHRRLVPDSMLTDPTPPPTEPEAEGETEAREMDGECPHCNASWNPADPQCPGCGRTSKVLESIRDFRDYKVPEAEGVELPKELEAALIWLEEASEAVGESRSCEDPPELLTGHIATQSMARDGVLTALQAQKAPHVVVHVVEDGGALTVTTHMPLAEAVEFYDRITEREIGAGGAMICQVVHHVGSEFAAAELIGETQTAEPVGWQCTDNKCGDVEYAPRMCRSCGESVRPYTPPQPAEAPDE